MNLIELANRAQLLLLAPRLDDDFSDRLNYRFTVGLLIFFAIIIITKQSGVCLLIIYV